MTVTQPDTEQLRQLIGHQVQLQGRTCQVIEVLEDGPCLVVECMEGPSTIQGNQFGDGSRRVQQHHTVPVYSSVDRDQLHPVFAEIWQGITEPPTGR